MLTVIMAAIIAALLITVLAAQKPLVSQACRLTRDTETFPK